MELPDPRNPAHSKDRPETIPADVLGSRADQESVTMSIGVPGVANAIQTSYPEWATGRVHSEAIDPGWHSAGPGSRIVSLPRTPSARQRIDYRRLALAFFRRWILASIVGSLVGIVTGVITWAVVPAAKYTATARLQVAAVPPMFMYKTRETTTDYAMFRQTQLALLKSQQVIDAALRSSDVAELKGVETKDDPGEWLREQLSVSFASGSEVLEIALSGDDPKTVAALVNAITGAYLDEVVNVDHLDRQRRFEGLKEIWKKYESDLRQKREQLRKIAEAIGSDDKKALTLQKQYEVDRQDLVRRNLIEVHGELLKRRAELEFAGDKNAKEPGGSSRKASEAEIEAELLKDPLIATHTENIRQYKEELTQQSRTIRNPGLDPSISLIRNKIRAEELAMSQRRKKMRPFVASQVLEVPNQEGTGKTEALRDQVAMLEKLESQYEHELRSIKEEMKVFNGKTFDFGLLQADVELDEKAAREVGDEIRHVELELNQASPRIKTFEKAKVPHVKDQDKKIRLSVMAGGAAFLLMVLAITFREYQTQRVGFAEDVVCTTGMTVMGTLPVLRRRGREKLGQIQGAEDQRRKDLLVESIDMTRLMLIRATQPQSLRVVMITSAAPGEGKTSLSSHLAVSLSRTGRRTLLLDFDLRNPTLHHILEAPRGPGLSEYLRGEVELADIIRPTAVAHLSLISAGNCDDLALAALAQRDLGSMFRTLKTAFDFVVVDTSPVLSVADPLVIGLQVDTVVFAVMNDLSRIPDVLTAYNRLITLGIRVLGAVVAGERIGSKYYYTRTYDGNQ